MRGKQKEPQRKEKKVLTSKPTACQQSTVDQPKIKRKIYV